MLALLAGCGPHCRTPGDGPPNVVLVTLDTTRADHVGAFGGEDARTPNLDRLASEGAAFVEAYATSHITIPSHVSIMSSLPVATHGAASNQRPTRPVSPLLPLVLRDAGYQTAAFVSARHLGRGGPLGSVLGDAFDVYRSAADWWVPLQGEQTTERVGKWLRQACGRPFFAWVHYWDPHMPYAPPAPFDAGYDGDPTAPSHPGLDGVELGWSLLDVGAMRPVLARHGATVRALAELLGVPEPDVERLVLDPGAVPPKAPPEAIAKLDELRDAVRRELPLHPGLAKWLTGVRDPAYPAALYAGEVSYADHQVGELVDALDALGLGTQTVVVVVADHGESLGEHGIWFDHPGLYETTVRVPLVIWAPGRVAPARHTAPVSTIDVAPTILALLGVPAPPEMRGRDLLAPGAGARDVVAESVDRRQLMLRRERWKLIRSDRDTYYTDVFAPRRGTLELYDLASDPGERANLAAARPEIAAELSAALDAWEQEALVVAPPSVPVDELRALGYLP